MEGPPILKDEIKSPLRRMKYCKATGPDNISVEMLEALEDVGINKRESIMNYDTVIIPESLSRSIFVILPKKAGATECELHRTSSLMSDITKLMLKILMKGMGRPIREEIANLICVFTEGKGPTNAIFVMRNIIERSIYVQKDLYLCFIDYSKAFDKVRHDKPFDMLERLDIDVKALRRLKNLHWEQTTVVIVDSTISEWIKIEKGVRQGCVLSPDLFSLYN